MYMKSVSPGLPPTLQVEFTPGVLRPSESRQAVITFKPTAAQAYAARLPLEVNGLYTVHVDMRGEGSQMRLEVADPSKKTVHFGGVSRGQSSTRVVQVISAHAVI